MRNRISQFSFFFASDLVRDCILPIGFAQMIRTMSGFVFHSGRMLIADTAASGSSSGDGDFHSFSFNFSGTESDSDSDAEDSTENAGKVSGSHGSDGPVSITTQSASGSSPVAHRHLARIILDVGFPTLLISTLRHFFGTPSGLAPQVRSY